jgi:hypothetical protein
MRKNPRYEITAPPLDFEYVVGVKADEDEVERSFIVAILQQVLLDASSSRVKVRQEALQWLRDSEGLSDLADVLGLDSCWLRETLSVLSGITQGQARIGERLEPTPPKVRMSPVSRRLQPGEQPRVNSSFMQGQYTSRKRGAKHHVRTA